MAVSCDPSGVAIVFAAEPPGGKPGEVADVYLVPVEIVPAASRAVSP